MTNGKKCKGHHEDFAFGTTRFVKKDGGRQMLLDSLYWSAHNETYRPVVLIGHAVANDLGAVEKHLDIDLHALGVVATVLDTQVMAQELGIAKVDGKISLENLLTEFAIEEPYLHNAGNDIAQTMISAWLLAYETGNSGHYRGNPQNGRDVDFIKQAVPFLPKLIYGIETLCTRCNATSHLASQCRTSIFCTKCAVEPRYARGAYTHKTEKCGIEPRTPWGNIAVVPCEHCINSKKSKKWKNAQTHITAKCGYLRK